MKKKLLCVILLPLGLLAGFLLPAFMPFSGTDPGSGNGFSAQSTAENSHEAETVRTDAVSGSLEGGPSEESKEEREVEKPAIPAERPLEEIPFDGQLAHQYLTELCAIGPRPSGSEGMKKQQEYLIRHFTQCGAEVQKQAFRFPYPGSPTQKVDGMNLIFRWRPERKERILFCAHYDTLPIPTADPIHMQHLPFVGAEDNAGGIGILMVLAKELPKILAEEQTRYGVDIVMLDAEEFMFRPSRQLLPNERFCWGSEYFGRVYASQSPAKRGFTYTAGVLLDLVTQHDVLLMKEAFSFKNQRIRMIQSEIWNTAKQLGVREFVPQIGTFITDDHLYLYEFGKIPVVDIIDLDYEFWHTHEDTPDKCSPLSAARVGWVVSEWLRNKK